MSVERYFHWTCNFCGITEKKVAHGFPKGWTFVQERMEPIRHKCIDCVKKEKSCQ